MFSFHSHLYAAHVIQHIAHRCHTTLKVTRMEREVGREKQSGSKRAKNTWSAIVYGCTYVCPCTYIGCILKYLQQLFFTKHNVSRWYKVSIFMTSKSMTRRYGSWQGIGKGKQNINTALKKSTRCCWMIIQWIIVKTSIPTSFFCFGFYWFLCRTWELYCVGCLFNRYHTKKKNNHWARVSYHSIWFSYKQNLKQI